MYKIASKGHDSSHDSVNFLTKAMFIGDSIKSKCKCLLDGIENVFNRTIKSIIRCSVNDSVTSIADHLLDKYVPRNKEKHALMCDRAVTL